MIIRLTGGIGNQMFQYALKKEFDYLLGKRNFIDLRYYDNVKVHNGYELERVFQICEENVYEGIMKAPSENNPILYKILNKMNKRIIKTKCYLMEILITFYPEFKELTGEKFYLDGYWQSEEYFINIAEDIRSCFEFPVFDEPENTNLVKKMEGRETVSLHVRRGDFLKTSKYICLGNTNYYEKAIAYIRSKVKNPVFVVLSDNIDWCRRNFHFDKNTIYVNWNVEDKSFRDMQIMSLCRNNIIANSSFSWWGAWLNEHKNKIVVAPYKFYNGTQRDESHLLPKSWISMEFV